MAYSIRLELTCVCSLNDFSVAGLYRGLPLFFLECVYLSLIYPSLIFDMFLSLCVCVCVRARALEWFWISLTVIFPLCERVSWGFLCECMCGRVVGILPSSDTCQNWSPFGFLVYKLHLFK